MSFLWFRVGYGIFHESGDAVRLKRGNDLERIVGGNENPLWLIAVAIFCNNNVDGFFVGLVENIFIAHSKRILLMSVFEWCTSILNLKSVF